MDLFDVRYDLPGWEVFAVLLTAQPGAESELAALRLRVAAEARRRLDLGSLSGEPAVAALRRLFKEAGCDPSRYRPSSEALLRRLLKGDELPAIQPLVDLNNCLSTELRVPCCVMAEGTFGFPLTLRAGRPGEAYDSLKGPFRLEGKPLLADPSGPVDAPITGSERVKVRPETERAWLVAYLPTGVVPAHAAREALEGLLAAAPVARLAG